MQYKKTNIKRNKQNKVFLLTQCLLPLGISISPMEYLSPYKCAWEIKFLPLRMCTRVIKKWQNTLVYFLEYTLPLFVRNRQKVKEKRRQEMKVWTMVMMHEGCKMNELLELLKTKKHVRIFVHMLKYFENENHILHNSLCESNSLIRKYKRRNRILCDKIYNLKKKI